MALQIAIPVYPQMTVLDAVGPYEVLSRIPGARVSWVAQHLEPVITDAGLTLLPTATFESLPRPAVVVVPGGREAFAIRQPALLVWLREVHPHTRFTSSVCTGSLVLGAAGLLRGVRATGHKKNSSCTGTATARRGGPLPLGSGGRARLPVLSCTDVLYMAQ